MIGAVLALVRDWSDRTVGLVLGFGAGALISAVAFELAAEGEKVGGLGPVGAGVAAGALTYYLADGRVERMGAGGTRRGEQAAGAGAGTALALGAFLDGIPEQLVLGIGLASGEGVSLGLMGAIFVSNLPEAIGSASDMRRAGHARGAILRLWGGVAVLCALASGLGQLLADSASDELQAAVNGFAAGALIVMLVDSMIPEATKQAGRITGLVTTLGFAVAAVLSATS